MAIDQENGIMIDTDTNLQTQEQPTASCEESEISLKTLVMDADKPEKIKNMPQ